MWDKLKEKIGNIWEMILDGVASWLETTIIKKALVWVATKLDPTGVMAIITTIIDVFNVIQAIADKAREILEIINGVLDGIADLIKGIIAAAANFFEKALAAAIPVILAILGYLFGLDGVVDEVKKQIEALREKIANGVLAIVKKMRAFVERIVAGVKDAVEALFEWWKARKEFNATDGESHELYFTGKEEQAVLIVASKNPKPFQSFLNNLDTSGNNDKAQAKASALPIAAEIDRLKQTNAANSLTKEQKKAFYEQKKQKLEELLGQISPYCGVLLAGQDLPTGTQAKPIKMIWYKPNSYYHGFSLTDADGRTRTFNFGGGPKSFKLNQEAMKGRTRGSLSTRLTDSKQGLSIVDTNERGSYVEIGVEGHWKVDKGKVMNKTGSYRGVFNGRYQQAMRLILERHGFNLANIDMDHLTDLQFGGLDDMPNLWPLDRSINQSSLRFANQIVKYQDEHGNLKALPLDSSELKGKYFIVDDIHLF